MVLVASRAYGPQRLIRWIPVLLRLSKAYYLALKLRSVNAVVIRPQLL